MKPGHLARLRSALGDGWVIHPPLRDHRGRCTGYRLEGPRSVWHLSPDGRQVYAGGGRWEPLPVGGRGWPEATARRLALLDSIFPASHQRGVA